MTKTPIARLPFGPSDPWHRFITTYESLPLKTTGIVRRKSLLAHSSLLVSGVRVSSTLTYTKEIGRLTFQASERLRLIPENTRTIIGWGWRLLNSGPDELAFVKELDLIGGTSTMPMAMILPLPLLGVTPDQDWGAK